MRTSVLWIAAIGGVAGASLLITACGGDTTVSTTASSGASAGSGGAGGAATVGSGGASATSSSSSSGGGGSGGQGGQGGSVDPCAACDAPGTACVGGQCVADCTLPSAKLCVPGTVCNVSDKAPGQCVAIDSGCVVGGQPVACGAFACGPGTTCNSVTQTCAPSLPCTQMICDGMACHGASCPCQRPAPSCAAADLAALNGAAFMDGLVDLDFDLSCNAWGVTVISGPDYLRKMEPGGAMTTVQGVTNLNMGEVAAIQGLGGQFGGAALDVALTYNCCAGCGCKGDTPQGVAYFDAPNDALPMVIPTLTITGGVGPFKSSYLDTGPQGLTYALSRELFVGNVDAHGDLHTINLDTQQKGLVAVFGSRVYAATAYDGRRLLVALESGEIFLLDTPSGMSSLFATSPGPVTSLARDPFTGHVFVAVNGGAIHELDGQGAALGVFATGQKSGRIALARDNALYHLNVAPVGVASVERFALPDTY